MKHGGIIFIKCECVLLKFKVNKCDKFLLTLSISLHKNACMISCTFFWYKARHIIDDINWCKNKINPYIIDDIRPTTYIMQKDVITYLIDSNIATTSLLLIYDSIFNFKKQKVQDGLIYNF